MRTVPEFKIGEQIRIMQTSEMVEKELANLKGTIIGIYDDEYLCEIELFGFDKPVFISPSHLSGI